MYLVKATLFMLSVASLTVNATNVERFENWVREFRQEFRNTEHREGIMPDRNSVIPSTVKVLCVNGLRMTSLLMRPMLKI